MFEYTDEDRARALKFQKCGCKNRTMKGEVEVCDDCGFMRSFHKAHSKNNKKISKRDQLADI